VAEVDQIPAGHRYASNLGVSRGGVGLAESPAPHVFDELRHEFFGFAQHEMVDVREGRMAGREERSPAMTGLHKRRQRSTMPDTDALCTIMALIIT